VKTLRVKWKDSREVRLISSRVPHHKLYNLGKEAEKYRMKGLSSVDQSVVYPDTFARSSLQKLCLEYF
jgi:hypothetical protein